MKRPGKTTATNAAAHSLAARSGCLDRSEVELSLRRKAPSLRLVFGWER